MSYRESDAYGSSDHHDNPQAWVIGVDKSEVWRPRAIDKDEKIKSLEKKNKLALLLIDKFLELLPEKEKEIVRKFVKEQVE